MQSQNQLGGNIQNQNQQLVQQQQQQQQVQQARLPPGQQVNQQMQTSPQSIPPQVQMNMLGLSHQQRQASQLQMAQSQQQPQQHQQQQQPAQQQPQQTQQQAQQAPASQQRKTRPQAKKAPPKKGQDAANAIPINNTPPPTMIPEPSPAQHPSSLPNSTPMNVASPALMHHPGSTPSGSGISPTDTHTPTQGNDLIQQTLSQVDFQGQDFKNAQTFVRMEMEKLKNVMMNQMSVQQPKRLTPEQKQRMAGVVIRYSNARLCQSH